ncbi:ABC transporter permease [Desulfosediminicola ganghwensis]|uniref:ABC transporter permease n=1 Tax=Desulfosediminicola ganghwensis TaxID=2569540 RepID=UPI0010ACAD01|nr:ABC transporter permease [Desulfosediminicola ganghwensis]
MMSGTGVQRKSEWRLLVSDPWLQALTGWLPLLLFLMIYAIFAQGLPRDLAIGVVDLDKSQLSRMLVRGYDSSPTLAVTRSYSSLAEGLQDMRGGELYGVVLIGRDSEKHMMLGIPPEVNGFYNSQYLLTGKLVKAALAEAHMTTVARIDVKKRLLGDGARVVSEALAGAVPVSTQVTALYNISRNYAQFLCTAIIPAIWQILIVMVTVYSFSIELRNNPSAGLGGWLQDKPFSALLNKLVPYTCIFWFQGLVTIIGMFVIAGWPMHGSFAVLACAQLLTVCACQAMGALIFFLIRDAARAISTAGAFSAPGLAFMGVTFPVTDMIYPAQVWRSLLPVSHYMDIQITQANYGATIGASMSDFINLFAFVVPALIVLALAYRYRLKESEIVDKREAGLEGEVRA